MTERPHKIPQIAIKLAIVGLVLLAIAVSFALVLLVLAPVFGPFWEWV